MTETQSPFPDAQAPFKAGDRLVCVDAWGQDLTNGREYVCLGVSVIGRYPYLKVRHDCNQKSLFRASRFRHADAPVEALPANAPYQQRVNAWMQHCFGPEISADRTELNHRFLEEALELVQSGGCTQSEAHQLVDYVFGRDVGELPQEVGGVKVTLAALCNTHGVDMEEAGETELQRVWGKSEQIRAKHAAKPKHSPLPEVSALVENADQPDVNCVTAPDGSCIAEGACMHSVPTPSENLIETLAKENADLRAEVASIAASNEGLEFNWKEGQAELATLRATIAERDAEIARLREALQRLADAADAVGVRFFDTDTRRSLGVEAMQEATTAARDALAGVPK